MEKNLLLDLMLRNENMIYSSLFLIIVIGFFLFKKLNILSFFILALFVGVKLSIHYYVDEYIDSKKN